MIVFVAVALTAAAFVFGLLVGRWRVSLRRVLPVPIPCPRVRLAELRPSSGLAWSRQQYPDQYADADLRTVRLTGLDDYANERFLDVADRSYSGETVRNFSYFDGEGGANVSVEYLPRAETFVGTLTATGLKPNFAYQLKLRGFFSDRVAFERIGHVGRWRLPGLGTNYRDDRYDAYPDKSKVESYLLFDFFVTDPEGRAVKEFYVDSTLHVLFNANWQRGAGPNDSRPVQALPLPAGPTTYSNARAARSVQRIYAQSEQHALGESNRPAIGLAYLPPGPYTAEVVLTEESFHGFGDSGYWATVMAGPVEFEVLDQPRPVRRWSEGDPVLALSAAGATTSGVEVEPVVDGRLHASSADKDAYIDFEEELVLPAEGRYYASLEISTKTTGTFLIVVDEGRGFKEGARYRFSPAGCGRWQVFEVELTGAVAGRTTRIRIRPPKTDESFSIRNLAIHRMGE